MSALNSWQLRDKDRASFSDFFTEYLTATVAFWCFLYLLDCPTGGISPPIYDSNLQTLEWTTSWQPTIPTGQDVSAASLDALCSARNQKAACFACGLWISGKTRTTAGCLIHLVHIHWQAHTSTPDQILAEISSWKMSISLYSCLLTIKTKS